VNKASRCLTLLAALALASLNAFPQGGTVRVGLLGPDEQPRFSDIATGLRQGLREQGHAAGAIDMVEARVQRGDAADAKRLVDNLVAQRLAVLFVIGSSLAKLARDSVPELPIVFITPGDPVAAGMVSSFARPGRNMTALMFEYPELSAKRLELLRDLVPSTRRVLMLYDPRDASPRQGAAAAREAARKLGLTLIEVEVRNRQQITAGLGRIQEADALLGIPGGITSAHYEAIIRAANLQQRPTILFTHSASTQEALLSYGANDVDVARQAARALGKILQGANAGDLAVERPSKLTLVINLRTAKTLGVTVPPAVLLRADHVIE
jgi:putative tryptophan/tyrosine transport system substrate-binding protein